MSGLFLFPLLLFDSCIWEHSWPVCCTTQPTTFRLNAKRIEILQTGVLRSVVFKKIHTSVLLALAEIRPAINQNGISPNALHCNVIKTNDLVGWRGRDLYLFYCTQLIYYGCELWYKLNEVSGMNNASKRRILQLRLRSPVKARLLAIKAHKCI